METGRVNQKRRTRAAIVEAAQRLMADGAVPTVAEAAAAADVGRTTAYRYFPTQESLLVELTVTQGVAGIEELVAAPVDPASAVDRTVEVVLAFVRHVLDEEVRYRTALRLYQDQWLAAHSEGDPAPLIREGRRRRWFETTLAPLVADGSLTKAARDRLIVGLSMLCGAEAVVVLHDVCRLSDRDALAAAEWSARSLIAAAVSPPGGP